LFDADHWERRIAELRRTVVDRGCLLSGPGGGGV